MVAPDLTLEMIVVLCVLGLAAFLFVSEIVRVDLAAILVMVLLGILSLVPGLGGLADVSHLFDGFASNAVISIVAVMIIGAGLDKTGVMSRVAALILRVGGTSERRVIPLIGATVGGISGFMQNVGAAALFLPVASRIALRARLSLSRLLMPVGFCAILGGTMTMVGSSPLILLNDLLETANTALPSDQRMAPFSLFSVTPVGLALLAAGIVYFVVFGSVVLPARGLRTEATTGQSASDYFRRLYGLDTQIFEIEVPADNDVAGETIIDLTLSAHFYIIGTYYKGYRQLAPLVSTEIEVPCRLAVLGKYGVVSEYAQDHGWRLLPRLEVFAEDFAPTNAGIAEIVIPPDSSLIGKSAQELRMRKTYGLKVLAIYRGEEALTMIGDEEHEPQNIGILPLRAGDTLVVHTQWDGLARLQHDRDFVIVTSDYPREELRPKKVGWAVFFFVVALAMILFADIRLSLCLLTGAAGMLVTRVLTIDEAYRAVGWNTVFLLASLIPLGQAVQNTGTADWIAYQILAVLEGYPVWALQAGIAVLATVFTLVMSNIGATVLLVPFAISIAIGAGGDPALFAMTVAIATSNSFLIPTHQVNALIMGPGGYRVRDFLRAGGIMTILFLVVSLVMLNIVFG